MSTDPIIINEWAGQIFEVGKPFEDGVTSYPEGMAFDISEIGCTIVLHVNSPTAFEIKDVRTGDLTLAIVEMDEVIFVTTNFGSSLQMEPPFNINLSQLRTLTGNVKAIPEEPPEGKGYQLIIFLVDASSGIINGIRQIGLSWLFSKELKGAIERQDKFPFNREVYEAKIDKIYQEVKNGTLVSKANTFHKLHNNKWTVINN